jgi:hypothetical protein
VLGEARLPSPPLPRRMFISSAEELKVQVKNDESQRICFSSCYPYVVQSRAGSWDTYPYPQCAKAIMLPTPALNREKQKPSPYHERIVFRAEDESISRTGLYRMRIGRTVLETTNNIYQ